MSFYWNPDTQESGYRVIDRLSVGGRRVVVFSTAAVSRHGLISL